MNDIGDVTWQDILALISNKATRSLFAKVEIGPLTADDIDRLSGKEKKAFARLQASGIVRWEDGVVRIDSDVLRSPLTREAKHSPKSVIDKYFDGVRLHTMPRRPEDRISALRWIVEQVVPENSTVTETSLNERLSVFHPDVAMLRRYMVDLGLLDRSQDGSSYYRADSVMTEAQPIRMQCAVFTLDCADAQALGEFYARLLGWRTHSSASYPQWVDVLPPEGEHSNYYIGCQQIEDYRAPEWPEGAVPQQAHLDFYVESIAESTPLALAAGAAEHPHQPSEDGKFLVLLDPAGHPFCLCEK